MNWYNRQLKIAIPGPHGVNRRWSKEDLDVIKELIEEGNSFPQIASLFNVNRSTIQDLNKKYKWKDFKKERDKKDKFIASLYRLPPNGKSMTTKAIFDRYGVNSRTIRSILKRLGISEEYRDIGDASRLRFTDPAQNEQLSTIQKQRHMDNPEIGENHSLYMQQQWKDNYPEGWKQFINRFPPEKQKEIERDMISKNKAFVYENLDKYL